MTDVPTTARGRTLPVQVDAVRALPLPSADVQALLLARVSPARRARVARYVRREDAVRSIVSEVLLRCVIRDRIGLMDADMAFREGEHDKPFLAGHPSFHFNLSHSGDWVVCATGGVAVGVDVECMRLPVPDILDRVLSPAEREHWSTLPESEQATFFFTRWTVKESYAKALGIGLALPFQDVTIEPGPGSGFVCVRDGSIVEGIDIRSIDVDAGHRLAVCAVGAPAPASMTVRDAGAIAAAW